VLWIVQIFLSCRFKVERMQFAKNLFVREKKWEKKVERGIWGKVNFQISEAIFLTSWGSYTSSHAIFLVRRQSKNTNNTNSTILCNSFSLSMSLSFVISEHWFLFSFFPVKFKLLDHLELKRLRCQPEVEIGQMKNSQDN
jgi:hypothetical protein